MIIPLPENRVAGAHAELSREDLPDQGPEYKNAGTVASLDRPARFDYNGRTYEVPPVPFAAALEMQRLTALMRAIDTQTALDGAGVLERVRVLGALSALLWTLCRPVGLRRYLRRFLPNPFRSMSLAEAGQLVGFIYQHRTTSRVRFPSAPGHRSPLTS